MRHTINKRGGGAVVSPEDVASIVAVVGMLEAQAARLGPNSKIAHLWRDGIDLLRPAAAGESDRALTIRLAQVTPPTSQ